MKTAAIPQGPWYNAMISEGIYDAKIIDLIRGQYGQNKDMYLQIVLWLAQPECYLVTNLYFPRGKPDSKTVQRLSRLSQICGLLPQDAIDMPQSFHGAELKIQIKKFMNNDREYTDVDKFLHSDVIATT